jgi:integrase
MDTVPMVIPKLDKGNKYIPKDWVTKFYDTIDNIRDKTYILYHIETGLRVSDVVNTEIVHIDWAEYRTYTYDHKKDSWRFIYWPEFVKAQLKQWLLYRQAAGIKDPFLFPFSTKTANRILKHWAVKLDFPYKKQISSHWLRHTYIRHSRAIGRDIKAVQQNTGDTIKTILDWYSDLSKEDLQREANK